MMRYWISAIKIIFSIEDAAESLGSTYRGKISGSFGTPQFTVFIELKL